MAVDTPISTYINAIKLPDLVLRIAASAQKIEVYVDLPLAMNYERVPGARKRIKDPFGTGEMR